MARISVVISTYNRAERLVKAIESVLNQTYQDFEIVVVDDGSTDNTTEVVNNFKSDKIRYFKSPKNFGTDTQPKNIGVRESKGEYIAFLDDDNDYRPDHLNVLVKELDKNPEMAGVYGDRFVVDDLGQMAPRLGVCSDFNPALLLKQNYIDTSDVLIRREALIKVGGFDERYRKYVDWNLWLRMAKAGYRFKHIPLVITNYHLHGEMKSVTVKDQKPAWDPFDVEIHLPYLGEVKEPRIAIFSITYDRLEYTKLAFESLRKTAGRPFDHYVVDNGSKDRTPKWLQQEMDARRIKQIILNPDNKGISIASNQALDAIGTEYDIVVKFDNDCICLTQGWLAKMVEIWKSNHMIALSCYVQGLKDNPGGAQRIGYGYINRELIGMTKHLGGICHFVDFKGYRGFRWPETEQLHGVQDLEFSQHLLFNGYQMGYLENYYVNHGPMGSEAQYKDYKSYFERRKKEKVERYEKN